jgi:hypothetical protein
MKVKRLTCAQVGVKRQEQARKSKQKCRNKPEMNRVRLHILNINLYPITHTLEGNIIGR